MTLVKKTLRKKPDPSTVRELSVADVNAVAGGMRLNPQPLPPYSGRF